jgi:hypothetical protein
MRCIWSSLVCALIGGAAGLAQQPAHANSDAVTYEVGVNGVKAPLPIQPLPTVFPQGVPRGLSGKCAVSLIVDVKGHTQKVQIIRCTDPIFAQSSLDSVRKYRFHPATTADGLPVQVAITLTNGINSFDGVISLKTPVIKVDCQFHAPAGGASAGPDSAGIYSLTGEVQSPRLIQFSDEGYAIAAFDRMGNSPCDMVLTIDEKGAPVDFQNVHCENSLLEKSAVKSLLSSRFEPGSIKGNAAPVRAAVHLEFISFASPQ